VLSRDRAAGLEFSLINIYRVNGHCGIEPAIFEVRRMELVRGQLHQGENNVP
jgi:hypothetical protein